MAAIDLPRGKKPPTSKADTGPKSEAAAGGGYKLPKAGKPKPNALDRVARGMNYLIHKANAVDVRVSRQAAQHPTTPPPAQDRASTGRRAGLVLPSKPIKTGVSMTEDRASAGHPAGIDNAAKRELLAAAQTLNSTQGRLTPKVRALAVFRKYGLVPTPKDRVKLPPAEYNLGGRSHESPLTAGINAAEGAAQSAVGAVGHALFNKRQLSVTPPVSPIQEVNKAMAFLRRPGGSGQQKLAAGLPPSVAAQVVTSAQHTLKHGALGTGSEVVAGLDRPVAAVEAAVAKAGVETGLIHGATAAHIKAARGPIQAFLHGRRPGKDITGGDITQGLLRSRKLGIIPELVGDPLMYAGLALEEGSGGAASGLVASRFRRALGLAKGDASAARGRAFQQQVHDARVTSDATVGRIQLHTDSGKTTTAYLGGKERLDAAAARGLHSTEKAPQVGLRLHLGSPLNPVGRSKVSVAVPGSKLLSHLPVGVRHAERARLVEQARIDAQARAAKEEQAALQPLKARLLAAGRKQGNHAEVQGLENEIRAVREKFQIQRAKYIKEASVPQRVETLATKVARRNARMNIRNVAEVADQAAGRGTTAALNQKVKEALTPLKELPRAEQEAARQRVSLWLQVQGGSDHSILPRLEGALGGLSPQEQLAVQNMRKVFTAAAQHGTDIGTLSRVMHNYGGPLHWVNEAEGLTYEKLRHGVLSSDRSPVMDSSRGRFSPSMFDLAGRESVVNMLRSLSKNPLSERQAGVLADELHAASIVRQHQELMVRAAQRGAPFSGDLLGRNFHRAIEYGERFPGKGGDINQQIPLFAIGAQGENEGKILLSPAAKEAHGLDVISLPEGQLDHARLLSAQKDLQRIDHLIGHTTDPEHLAELQALRGHVADEIARYDTRVTKASVGEAAHTAAKVQLGVTRLPPKTTLSQVLDGQGNLWLRDRRSGEPLPGLIPARRVPAEAAPYEDPYDLTSRLPDVRHAGMLPEMDLQKAMYLRARQTGRTSAIGVRFKAIDRQVGRSVKEAAGGRYEIVGSDKQYSLRNVELTHTDPNAGINTYYDHLRKRAFTSEDVVMKEPGLLHVGGKGPNAYYMDPRTGQTYAPVSMVYQGQQVPVTLAADRLWPTQTIDDMRSFMASQGETERIYQTSLNSGVQKVLGYFRYGVTTPIPAYHIRNMVSDLFKSLQSDTGVLFHPIVNAKLSYAAFGGKKGFVRIPGFGKMPMEDFLLLADTAGVRTGHHVAEVMHLGENSTYDANSANVARRLLHQLGPRGAFTKFGAAREDVVRFQTFAQHLRRTNGDVAEAMMQTMRHHFNYNDLSMAEKRFARNVFLFYTWYRKNIPLQAIEVFRRPGFFSGITHSYDASTRGETPLGGPVPFAPELPGYITNQLQSFPLDWKGHALYVGFGAPWADLNLMSFDGVKSALTFGNPAISTAIQLWSRKNILTGARMKERESSGIASAIDAIASALGSPLPKDKNGKATLPWWADVILRQVPIAGRGTGGLSGPSPYRDPGQLQSLGTYLAPLTGLNIQVMAAPGSPREKKAIQGILTGQTIDRQQYISDLSNLPHIKSSASKGKYYTGLLKGLAQAELKGKKDVVAAIQKKVDASPAQERYYLNKIAGKDRQILAFAKEHGIEKYLSGVSQSGFYKNKPRGGSSGVSLGP